MLGRDFALVLHLSPRCVWGWYLWSMASPSVQTSFPCSARVLYFEELVAGTRQKNPRLELWSLWSLKHAPPPMTQRRPKDVGHWALSSPARRQHSRSLGSAGWTAANLTVGRRGLEEEGRSGEGRRNLREKKNFGRKYYCVQSLKTMEGVCNNVLLTAAALHNAYRYKPSIPQMQSGSRGSLYSIPYCCLNPDAFGRNSIINTVDVFCTVRGSTSTENAHSRLSHLSCSCLILSSSDFLFLRT